MKLGISKDIHERAKTCAEAVQETLTAFIGIAVSFRDAGKLNDVAVDEKLRTATRVDRVIVTFTGDDGEHSSQYVKEALIRAVLFAEARNPAKFVPDGVDGAEVVS